MFAALREGFHHTITRETATAKLTNALASLGATPEQIEDWCRAFAADIRAEISARHGDPGMPYWGEFAASVAEEGTLE